MKLLRLKATNYRCLRDVSIELSEPGLRFAVHTARVSEEIARVLDAENISRRSPSFRGFLEALLNGVARA